MRRKTHFGKTVHSHNLVKALGEGKNRPRGLGTSIYEAVN